MTPFRRPPPLRRAFRASLLALAGTAALLVAPAHASWLAADPTYMGYRIPEHRWRYWTASVNASGSHRSSTFGSNDRFWGGGLGGGLGTRMGAGYDSDRLLYSGDLQVDVAGGRSSERREDQVPGLFRFVSRSTDENLDERFFLGGALRTYPWSIPLGLSISTQHRLELVQDFFSANASNSSPPIRNETTNGLSQGERRYTGSASAWLGLGRVRDATPVQRALELEKRLRQTGAITRPLSDGSRGKLAALFSVDNHFGQAHERPTKYFWREVERLLREDGGLGPGSLDAYDVLRVLEPIGLFGPFPRRTGFFVGPAVTISTSRFHATREQTSSWIQYAADTVFATTSASLKETSDDRRDDIFPSVSAEFYRPLSPRWQLDAWTRAAFRESGENPNLSSSLMLLYIFADRWAGSVRWSHDAVAVGHSRRFNRWSVGVRGELTYFLEDAWTLRLVASEEQLHVPGSFERRGSFQLGVTWLVSGLFETPGLMEAMRPAPPPAP